MTPIETIAGWFGGQGGERARKTLAIAFVALLAFSVVAPFLGFVAVDSDHAGTAAAAPSGDYVYSGDDNGAVKKLDATDGSEVWSVSHGAGVVSEVSVHTSGDIVFTGNGDNVLRALDASDGSVLWTSSAFGNTPTSIAPHPNGSVVYAGSVDNTVRAFDADTGNELWSSSAHSNNVQGVAVGPNGETVYSSSDDGSVKALDADTGGEIWSQSAAFGDSVTDVSAGPDGNQVYASVYDTDSKVSALDASDGSVVWETAFGSSMNTVSAGPNGTNVYAGGWDGAVTALDPATGGEHWNTSTNTVNEVGSSPSGDMVFSGDEGNDVRAFDPDTGTQQWSAALGVSVNAVAAGGESGPYGNPVSGEVADSDGNALEGVNVTLEQSGTLINSTTTNASGGYKFSGVDDGEYTVTASMDGFHDDAKNITVSGSAVTVNFNLSAIESGAAGEGQAIGLVEDDLGMFPPDDTDLVVHHRTSEYKPLWQASGDSPEDWKQYSWSEVATASFNWENRTWVGLTDGEYYRLEIDSRHGTWEDSGFRYDKAEMLGSTVWLRPETGHLDSNDDGTAGGSSSSGTNGPGDGSDSTSDDDSGADDDGFGPTALGSCTTTDGQDGVEVEYWDSGYETYELRANLSVDGESTYFIHKSFDSARGYYRGCLADAMTDNASSSRDTVFEHNATDLDGAVVSSGSTSYEPPIFGPSGVAPASTVERLGLLAGVLGALGALWFGGQRYVPGTAVEAWPVDSVSPAFGVGAPLVAVLGLDLAGGGVISAGLATGLAQIAPFAGIVGVTIAGYYALRWIRAPPTS